MMDISTTDIAAGAGGTITAGAMVLLILQNVKAISGDWLNGPCAEIAGGVASLIAVVLAFVLADADWQEPHVYAELFVAWMGVWVSARASYAMLFKVAVKGSPPEPNTEVPVAAVVAAEEKALS